MPVPATSLRKWTSFVDAILPEKKNPASAADAGFFHEIARGIQEAMKAIAMMTMANIISANTTGPAISFCWGSW